MTSLLIYDEHCGWSPSLNASKGTGGTEVHLVQIATWLATELGVRIEAICHDGHGQMEGGVEFHESRGLSVSGAFSALLTVRKSAIPAGVRAGRTLTLVTDDPRPEPHAYDHLLGRSTLVAVSEWQAGLYRELGHKVVVIPAMIDDAIYSRQPVARYPKSFGCFSAWNKGTEALLSEWPLIRPSPLHRLFVGSPYSEPDDAGAQCDAAGADWVGRLRPAEIVDHLAHVEAHLRVYTAGGETFGATDAMARALGCNVHVWCQREIGALDETVPGGAWSTRNGWEGSIRRPLTIPANQAKDFRVSTIMPMWAKLLETT